MIKTSLAVNGANGMPVTKPLNKAKLVDIFVLIVGHKTRDKAAKQRAYQEVEDKTTKRKG